MWQLLRSVSDTLGVGFLAMQLVKLIGMVFALVGPLKFIASLFEGIFPLLASFLKINLGISLNGMDLMSAAMVLSGTLIVWSSVATQGAMSTRYIFRFFMIPYAFLVILIAIVVQVSTPIVEINTFNASCKSNAAEASFYGSSCDEMGPQLAFWNDTFGDEPIAPAGTEPVVASEQSSDDDLTGASFIFALIYLAVILPLISIFVFFFKRLSVNRLLKRVTIAGGSAIGLALASTAYASAFG